MDEQEKKKDSGKIVDEMFPGNSYTNIKPRGEIESSDSNTPVKKKSKDITQKKTFGERIADSFLEVDHKAIRERLIFDMFIPWLKDTAEDLLHMILYGGPSRSDRRRDRDRPMRRDYNSIYDGRRGRDRDDEPIERQNFRRIRILIRDDRRRVAEGVIRDLLDEQENRGGGYITVKDLYSHQDVDLPTNYVQSSWGWRDLEFEDVRFTRDSDGWIIEMPKAEKF